MAASNGRFPTFALIDEDNSRVTVLRSSSSPMTMTTRTLRAIMDDAKTACQRDFGAALAAAIGKLAARGLSYRRPAATCAGLRGNT
jgi:hypothetical protein